MKVTSGSNDKTALFNSADYSSSKSLSREERKQRRKRMKCQSEGVFNMRSSLNTSDMPAPSPHIGEFIDRQPKLEAVTELVNVPVNVSHAFLRCVFALLRYKLLTLFTLERSSPK